MRVGLKPGYRLQWDSGRAALWCLAARGVFERRRRASRERCCTGRRGVVGAW